MGPKMPDPFDFNAPQPNQDGGSLDFKAPSLVDEFRSQRSGEPPKTRTVYILLALFLGLLGVHNFYAGRGIHGLVQLGVFFTSLPLMLVGVGFATMACLLLWVLLDIVTVKKDGNGKWLV